MSLISIFRNEDYIIGMSDSAQKAFYRFGYCYQPIATKIHFYEEKYIIQHCGLGTLDGKTVGYHINNFMRMNPNKNLNDLPKLILDYFKQFDYCNEIKKFGDESEIIITISGWENGEALVYTIRNISNSILCEKDDLIAHGLLVDHFKKCFYNNLNAEGILRSMFLSFGMVTMSLKSTDFFKEGEQINEEQLLDLLENDEFKKTKAAVNGPYDFIIINKDGTSKVQIDFDKEQRWLEEED